MILDLHPTLRGQTMTHECWTASIRIDLLVGTCAPNGHQARFSVIQISPRQTNDPSPWSSISTVKSSCLNVTSAENAQSGGLETWRSSWGCTGRSLWSILRIPNFYLRTPRSSVVPRNLIQTVSRIICFRDAFIPSACCSILRHISFRLSQSEWEAYRDARQYLWQCRQRK